MSALAPAMQAYFTDRLVAQRGASPNTIAAYCQTFRLLLTFACSRWARRASRASRGPPSRRSWSTSEADRYEGAKAVEEQRLLKIPCRRSSWRARPA